MLSGALHRKGGNLGAFLHRNSAKCLRFLSVGRWGGVAWAAVGFALFLQHVLGMPPCAWCVLQRLIFIVIGLVGFTCVFVRGMSKLFGLLGMLILSVVGFGAAVSQKFSAEASASCEFGFADRLINDTGLGDAIPWLFEATASCREAAVYFLGVPVWFWSGALFVVFAFVSAVNIWKFCRFCSPNC